MSRCGRRLWAVLFIGTTVISQCTHLILWLECKLNATLNDFIRLNEDEASSMCKHTKLALCLACVMCMRCALVSDHDRCLCWRNLHAPAITIAAYLVAISTHQR
jgi:hypothetical protein